MTKNLYASETKLLSYFPLWDWRKVYVSAMSNTSQDDRDMTSGVLKAEKQFTTRTINLEPGATKQLPVGSYAVSELTPLFTISADPDIGEQLGTSFEKLDIPGKSKYVAFYHLHNYSDASCQVTVTKSSV